MQAPGLKVLCGQSSGNSPPCLHSSTHAAGIDTSVAVAAAVAVPAVIETGRLMWLVAAGCVSSCLRVRSAQVISGIVCAIRTLDTVGAWVHHFTVRYGSAFMLLSIEDDSPCGTVLLLLSWVPAVLRCRLMVLCSEHMQQPTMVLCHVLLCMCDACQWVLWQRDVTLSCDLF